MLIPLLAYFSLSFAFIVHLTRIIKYTRMPLHLRWELHPIPSKRRNRRDYDSDYSKLQASTGTGSFFAELKFILTELAFFKTYYIWNKKYWLLVYPFHIGTFLVTGWVILLFAGALSLIAGINISPFASDTLCIILYHLTLIAGLAGFLMIFISCLGLLIKKLHNPGYRIYVTLPDCFILVLIMTIAIAVMTSWFLFDRDFTIFREFVKSLITFTPYTQTNIAAICSILLSCVFLCFSPFTSIGHFIAKYFTYHTVLWNTSPNLPGNNMNKEIAGLLNQIPNWSGTHFKSSESWIQLVLINSNK